MYFFGELMIQRVYSEIFSQIVITLDGGRVRAIFFTLCTQRLFIFIRALRFFFTFNSDVISSFCNNNFKISAWMTQGTRYFRSKIRYFRGFQNLFVNSDIRFGKSKKFHASQEKESCSRVGQVKSQHFLPNLNFLKLSVFGEKS